MTDVEACPLCAGQMQPFRLIEGVEYQRCDRCGTILAEPSFLEATIVGCARIYDDTYWTHELSAARQRGYGASLIRLGEVFYYARRPIRRMLDVSCGPGITLDAAAELLPEIADTFWGVEPFPPPPQYRTNHPNYRMGFLSDLDGKFDAGCCIEVIEHLPPAVLKKMLLDLASISNPNALWYFNSTQPEGVLKDDPTYLDPHYRGHIASYSLEGLRPVFRAAGFTVHPLPGRRWAFLAEYGVVEPLDVNGLFDRLWTILPENRDLLRSARFGNLILSAGLEGARCYLDSALAAWAISELRAA